MLCPIIDIGLSGGKNEKIVIIVTIDKVAASCPHDHGCLAVAGTSAERAYEVDVPAAAKHTNFDSDENSYVFQ
jgi:hypothetical protein